MIAPTLTTARLTLRATRVEDFTGYAAFLATDHARYMDGPHDKATTWRWFALDTAGWQINGFGGLMIEVDGMVVGQVCIGQPPRYPEVELGWFIYPEHQRKGYGFEAAMAMRNWAWANTGIASLVSYIAPDNAASRALAGKLGATEDMTAARPEGEGPADCVVYRHPAPDADGNPEAYA